MADERQRWDPERTCSACAGSLRWDETVDRGPGHYVKGDWVCIGCDQLQEDCECEPYPLECDVPPLAPRSEGRQP